MNMYCASCGAKNEYTIIKPKFCGQCSEAFDKAFKKTPKVEPPPRKKKPVAADDEDDDTDTQSSVEFKKPSRACVQISINRAVKTDDLLTMGGPVIRERTDIIGSEAVEGKGGSRQDIVRNTINKFAATTTEVIKK